VRHHQSLGGLLHCGVLAAGGHGGHPPGRRGDGARQHCGSWGSGATRWVLGFNLYQAAAVASAAAQQWPNVTVVCGSGGSIDQSCMVGAEAHGRSEARRMSTRTWQLLSVAFSGARELYHLEPG